MGTRMTAVMDARDSNGGVEAELLKSYLVDTLAILIMACLRLIQNVQKGDYNPAHHDIVPNVLKTFRLTLDMSRLDTVVSNSHLV
jgi:hypothetical protein